MKEKTPQEKKSLSYARDCRNNYGENNKASRKNVPLRKARVNRGYRRKVNQALQEIDTTIDLEQAAITESEARNIRRENWKKCADEPLGTFVERKLERRESHAGNGKSARKEATEFLKGLEIETEQEADGRWIAEAVGMNGILVYDETKEAAIWKCRGLARLVFLESLGAIEILEIKEKGTSVLIK